MKEILCSSVGKTDAATVNGGIVACTHKATRKGVEVEVTSTLFEESAAGVAAFCRTYGVTLKKDVTPETFFPVLTLVNRQIKTDDKNGTAPSSKFEGLEEEERQKAFSLEAQLKALRAKSKAGKKK